MAKFNDGKHIDEVVSRAPCNKHQRSMGEPCWEIYPNSTGSTNTRAACGSRIKSAGFVGTISETAIQTKRRTTEEFKKEVRV